MIAEYFHQKCGTQRHIPEYDAHFPEYDVHFPERDSIWVKYSMGCDLVNFYFSDLRSLQKLQKHFREMTATVANSFLFMPYTKPMHEWKYTPSTYYKHILYSYL